MKKFIWMTGFICLSFVAQSQTNEKPVNTVDSSAKTMIVDAACGGCKFGMEGKGCVLAVRINGKAYFVDGQSIDNHGDAHADDGMCNMIRQAEVSGVIKGDRYLAKSFKLVPLTKKTN